MLPDSSSTPSGPPAPGSSLLARLASACLGGVLRLDYLASNSNALHGNTGARPGKQGWWPATKRAEGRRVDLISTLAETEVETDEAATKARQESPRPSRAILTPRTQWTGRLPPLSSSEEYQLVLRVRTGCQQSRNRLIEQHLPLVISVAKRFGDRRLPLDDLIVEGCIGLMTAIEKFDAERGYRLSTYARWWISQAIALATMNQSNVVRVPVHVQRMARKAYKERESEADATDSDHGELDALAEDGSADHAPHAATGETLDTGLDQQLAFGATDSSDETLNAIASPEGSEPMDIIERLEEHVALENALEALTERERAVVRARFGLDDDEPQTFERIAQQLQLSDERVRQILKTAMVKLRNEFQR